MRMAFGLVSVLVTLGVIILIFNSFSGSYTGEVIKSGQKAREEVSQIAGMDADGVKATDSISLYPEAPGGKVDNLIVRALLPGGPMEKYYGLKVGDCIIATSEMDLRGMTDPELAKAMVFDAYAKKRELTVLRDGEKTKLPAGRTGASGATDPLQTQLEAIRGAR